MCGSDRASQLTFLREIGVPSQRKAILIVIGTFYPLSGGAEKQALQQCLTLRQRGFETAVVTFRHDNEWPAYEEIKGVPVTRVAGPLLGRRGKLPGSIRSALYALALATLAWKLWRRRRSYDLMHVYCLNMIALPTALACYFARRPMVIAVRLANSDIQVSGVTDQRYQVDCELHSSLISDGKAPAVGGDLEDLQRLGKPLSWATRVLLRRVEAVIIIISTRMRLYLMSHNFTFTDRRRDASGTKVPIRNPVLIPNSVDTDYFRPTETRSTDMQTVVCTARLTYQKGLDVLLRAWLRVHSEQPEARLLIAGIGPLEAELTEMAQKLRLGESVEFAGLQRDVVGFLHRGTIATLPSRWEGMPNAVLEAMACGLPCVATRVSGSEDIIVDGVSGLLVEPEDSDALAEALLSLLRDPARASALGSAARVRIEQKYGLGPITDAYVDLYHRMLDLREGPAVAGLLESQSAKGEV